MTRALTIARQQQLLGVIRDFQRERGYPPTVRELIALTDYQSSSSVVYALEGLAYRGHLRRDRDIARGIVLTEAPE